MRFMGCIRDGLVFASWKEKGVDNERRMSHTEVEEIREMM